MKQRWDFTSQNIQPIKVFWLGGTDCFLCVSNPNPQTQVHTAEFNLRFPSPPKDHLISRCWQSLLKATLWIDLEFCPHEGPLRFWNGHLAFRWRTTYRCQDRLAPLCLDDGGARRDFKQDQTSSHIPSVVTAAVRRPRLWQIPAAGGHFIWGSTKTMSSLHFSCLNLEHAWS